MGMTASDCKVVVAIFIVKVVAVEVVAVADLAMEVVVDLVDVVGFLRSKLPRRIAWVY